MRDGYSSSSMSSSDEAVNNKSSSKTKKENKSKTNENNGGGGGGRRTPVIDANEYIPRNGNGRNRSITPPVVKINNNNSQRHRYSNMTNDETDSGADDID